MTNRPSAPMQPTAVRPSKGKLHRLEMIRGFAAVYVVLHHLAGDRGIILLRFGQEAVILFFLLSGFVICFSTSSKPDLNFRDYFVLRFRRIFPVFVLALGLSYLCQSAPSAGRADAVTFLGNLCMMQDCRALKPGVFVDVFCNNSPLWSLSYEWWFYMMFYPLHRFVAPCWQTPVVFFISMGGLLTYSVFPNGLSLFALYLSIWWSGVELARSYLATGSPSFRTEARSLASLGILTVCLGWLPAEMVVRRQHFLFGTHPFLELRHFGAAMLIIAAALLWHRSHWVFFRTLFGVFGWIAPISYGLYAFHLPLLVSASYLDGYVPPRWAWAGYLLVMVAAAYAAEVLLQRQINRFLKLR